MPEDLVQPYEAFASHIYEETEKARGQLQNYLHNPAINDVGCVDTLTSKGRFNPPGGVNFLMNEGVLEEWIKIRGEAGVTKGVLWDHDWCGYKRVVMGLETLQQHREVLKKVHNSVAELNKKHHTNFQVKTESNGSAKPYMRER